VAFLRISIDMNEKRYFTGKPCPKGHVAERLKSNRTCIECLNIKKRQRGAREDIKAEDLKRLNSWEKANPHRKLARTRKRQIAKLKRTPKWLTPDDLFIIEEAYHLAKLRTETLGISYHVDHILPLQGKTVSGLHVPTNLQVIPAKLNLQKSNKHE
jgi:hypothetical protein